MGEWRKSSYSSANGADCVETASSEGTVLVRDTADRDGGTLAFTDQAWQEFTRRLRGAVRAPGGPTAARDPAGRADTRLLFC